MPESLTAESFAPHVGTPFSTTAQGYDEVLTLTGVAPGPGGLSDGREPFSLSFSGARTDLYINAGVLTLRHAAMGELAIDVTPVAKRADGTFEYQAIFN